MLTSDAYSGWHALTPPSLLDERAKVAGFEQAFAAVGRPDHRRRA